MKHHVTAAIVAAIQSLFLAAASPAQTIIVAGRGHHIIAGGVFIEDDMVRAAIEDRYSQGYEWDVPGLRLTQDAAIGDFGMFRRYERCRGDEECEVRTFRKLIQRLSETSALIEIETVIVSQGEKREFSQVCFFDGFDFSAMVDGSPDPVLGQTGIIAGVYEYVTATNAKRSVFKVMRAAMGVRPPPPELIKILGSQFPIQDGRVIVSARHVQSELRTQNFLSKGWEYRPVFVFPGFVVSGDVGVLRSQWTENTQAIVANWPMDHRGEYEFKYTLKRPISRDSAIVSVDVSYVLREGDSKADPIKRAAHQDFLFKGFAIGNGKPGDSLALDGQEFICTITPSENHGDGDGTKIRTIMSAKLPPLPSPPKATLPLIDDNAFKNEPLRKWTSRANTEIKGVALGYRDGNVAIYRVDTERCVVVSIRDLSDDDQGYVQSRLSEARRKRR